MDNNTNIICYDTPCEIKLEIKLFKQSERGSFVGYLTISCWNLIAKVVKQMKLLIKSLRCASQGLMVASHNGSGFHRVQLKSPQDTTSHFAHVYNALNTKYLVNIYFIKTLKKKLKVSFDSFEGTLST